VFVLVALLGMLTAVELAAPTAHAAKGKPGAKRAEQAKKRQERKKREDAAKKKSARKQGAGKPERRGRREAPQRKVAFSDEAVRQAVEKGKKFLWSQQKSDGSWKTFRGKYLVGPSCLAAYALLASGVSPLEGRMEKALEWLSKQPCTKTYSLGLRCNVWLLANRETKGKYSPLLRRDVVQLMKSTRDGSYNYDSLGNGKSSGDNSNSQFGVLGVWAGALGLAEIPSQYWLLVARHWQSCQHRDGGWCYRHGGKAGKKANPARCEPRATMTAAGLATLFVCFDNLFAEKFVKCNVNTEFRPIRLGLDWMDRTFVTALRGGKGAHNWEKHFCYFLYGVERVGLASGYKYFGTADWYKLGAQRLLAMQNPNGSVPSDKEFAGVIPTGFALLFLVRGQHPVAFNKLELDGDWNNRPRDMAGLTRHLSSAFERTMNWQIINLKVPVEEWHDAPIVYLSGAEQPKLTDPQLSKLRRYVWQGGTIFSVTECAGRGFSQGIREVYEKLFPGRPLTRLQPDHDLYDIHERLNGQPAFYEISNGVRPLVIHTDADLSRSWQLQLRRTGSAAFHAASNVLMYVTDKGELRNRGVSHWPRRRQGGEAGRAVRLARLKYDGNWDPEPLAYERLARLMAREAKGNLQVVSPVAVERLERGAADVATLTGTDHFTLGAGAAAALKAYVDGGGTLVIDAAGGSRAFGESALALLYGMFGRTAVRRLSASAPVYNLPGMEIRRVSYRRRARLERALRTEPNLRGVMIDGRLAVIFSAEDLTSGLLGCPSYNCVGYEPQSCFDLMRNAVLLAAGEKGQ